MTLKHPTYAHGLPDADLVMESLEFCDKELDGFNGMEYDSDSEVCCQRSNTFIRELVARVNVAYALKALCDEMAKEARRQALEEAADLADNYGDTYSVCRGIARSIRAISKSSPNPLQEQIANIGKEGG